MIDFENIKIIKKLASGMLGTAYLCEYNKKQYVIKIQHILEEQIKKNYNYELWRELDLYEYINTMNKKDQLFFTKLYEYQIFNNCNHKQIRPYKIDLNDKKNEFAQRLKKLDDSNWCVKYLLDYKGKFTLHKFLIKYNITQQQTYSVCLQIINIILLLYNGGYSHNDLHAGNIMINKTNNKYFIMNNIKINYNGYQLTAIDYGEVLNAKFNIKYNERTIGFIKDKKQWLFDEIYYNVLNVISNFSKKINACDKKKIDPFGDNIYENGIKQILNNHPHFYEENINKYIKLFPKGKKLVEFIYKNKKSKKSIYDVIRNDKNFSYGWEIIDRLTYEFNIKYPKLFKKYFSWCSCTEWLLPEEIILEYLLLTNTTDLVNFFINKIK